MKKFTMTVLLVTGALMLATSCGHSRHRRHRPIKEDTAKTEKVSEGNGAYGIDPGEIEDFEQNREHRPVLRSKPDAPVMATDLIGRSISEGVEDGYHTPDWRFKVEKGQVSNFRIEQVLADEPNLYQVRARVHLVPEGNYYYDTTLKITYVNSDRSGWVMDNVSSLGMDVMTNHAYDDCISCKIDEDGWGGTKGLFISNRSDTQLIVGGRIQTDNGWMRFSSKVPANGQSGVGGLFGGGSVTNYRIDFVVKEF